MCDRHRDAAPGRYVNAAYFAWGRRFELVWLSEPGAQHSRNIDAHGGTADAVYDSAQRWGGGDRGIQLFGDARAADGNATCEATALHGRRFPQLGDRELRVYRF